MAEGKVDNRGSAFGSDAQSDPPQIPAAEASQQDTVWRCFAVCGLRGFPFDLPDTPHFLTKKNDPLLGSKGSYTPRCHLASDARAFPVRQRKSRSIRFDFFFPSLLFFFSKDRHVGFHFLREGQFIFAVTLLRDTLEFSLGAHFIRRRDLLFHMPSDCMMCAF